MIRRAILVATLALTPALAQAEKNPAIEYRESLMHLIGQNVGPMSAMMKCDIPWDAARLAGWGKDLKALSTLNAMRGFPPGSEGGDAKPSIWSNMADFEKRMQDMQLEIDKLGDAAVGGDKAAIGAQMSAAGKACKGCHDEYKEED
ncbi:MAG: c-type cytochrome [Gammaproteobacteria bacterium]